MPLQVIDLNEWAEAEREAEVQHLIVQEARRPFDLSQDLLFRAVLLPLDDETQVWVRTLIWGNSGEVLRWPC